MNSLASLSNASQRPALGELPTSRNAQADQQVLANRLAQRLGLPASALKSPAADFSPEKVADRVLGFVEQRLASEAAAGASAERLGQLREQARAGIEQGFAEARDILDGLGLLQGQVAADIDETYQRIQEGLGQLQQPQTEAAPSAGGYAVAAYQERFAATAQTFDLAVTTRDGDRLRISIAQAAASYSEQGVLAAGDGQGGAMAAYSRSSSVQMGAFQISVEGELDEQEMAALGDLLKQVEGLSSSFYAGDMAGAFDRAMALDMDGSQLASLSLRLTQAQVRQATDAYAAVADKPAAINGALADYANGLLAALEQANQLAEQGRGLLESLLGANLALDPRLGDEQLDKAEALNRKLLDGLASLLAPRQEAA